jgi:hypothetical protein
MLEAIATGHPANRTDDPPPLDFQAVKLNSDGTETPPTMLDARDALVGMRVRLENEIRGRQKTFGVKFGKRR